MSPFDRPAVDPHAGTLPADTNDTGPDDAGPDGVGRRYRVGLEVARGGMGVVREAQDLRLDRSVALKDLLGGTPGQIARFRREVRITAQLQHPAVIPIYDAGTWPDGRPFFVMKLAGGRALDESIAQARTLEERLALVSHVVAAVDALAYAHGRRIVHRDLKPANVLVGAFGETFVIDWGLAKRLDDPSQDPDVAEPPAGRGGEGLTLAGAVMGTPAYMPPEQAAGAAVDARADVYSLGAILYHVLSGRPPYPGSESGRVVDEVLAKPPEPLARVQEGLPIELVTIVETAMRRDPGERYPSALEMGADLRRFQTGQLVGAHRYTAWQMLRRFVARHRFAVAAGTLAAVASFIGLGTLVARETARRRAADAKSRADVEIAVLEAEIGATSDAATGRSLETRLLASTRDALRARDELEALGASPGDAPEGELATEIHAVLRRLSADTYSIPPGFRDGVARFVAKEGQRRASVRARKDSLGPVVARELDALGLPEDFVYIPWVESRFDPDAVSPRGAVGLWQFERAAAEQYGLRVDGTDERRSPEASSRAAAHLLADRLAELGEDSALLAIASYNMGGEETESLLHEVALERGSWHSGLRSFWHLYRMRRLPPEVMAYVPKVVGAAVLDGAGKPAP